MNWPEVTLKDVSGLLQYGFTASAEEEEVGPKFLRITDIVPPRIDWASVPYCRIDETTAGKYALAAGDIVIARTGNTTGYAKLIRDEVPAVFASYLVRIRVDCKKCDSGYVGRVVESDLFKRYVNGQRGGAAQGNANAQVLAGFRFGLPPLAVQRKIVNVLSAYDDLIENNTRRIKLLEDAARLLYEEWFVRLRFPGHEHTPIRNRIPEGWERRTLEEAAPLNYGKALKQDDREPGPYPVFGSSGIVGTHAKSLVDGPGIVVGRKGNVGSVYLSLTSFWPIDTVYYVGSECFSYYLLHNLQYQNFISSDVAVPGLNRSFAHSLPVLVPPRVLLEQFEDQARAIYRQVFTLQQLNQKLCEARDLLLPRLMNGEIAV